MIDKKVLEAATLAACHAARQWSERDLLNATEVVTAAIKAAEAALWSDDMDAAPKDGTEIMVAVNKTIVAIVRWSNNTLRGPSMYAGQRGVFADYIGTAFPDATHWRHLPTMADE